MKRQLWHLLSNANAMVGRWRSVNQEWQSRCQQAWQPFLDKFSYAFK
jgi:hypothetical protein